MEYCEFCGKKLDFFQGFYRTLPGIKRTFLCCSNCAKCIRSQHSENANVQQRFYLWANEILIRGLLAPDLREPLQRLRDEAQESLGLDPAEPPQPQAPNSYTSLPQQQPSYAYTPQPQYAAQPESSSFGVEGLFQDVPQKMMRFLRYAFLVESILLGVGGIFTGLVFLIEIWWIGLLIWLGTPLLIFITWLVYAAIYTFFQMADDTAAIRKAAERQQPPPNGRR